MENKMFNDILDAIISNATPVEIEIIREKLNEYLINYDYENRVSEELSKKMMALFALFAKVQMLLNLGKIKRANNVIVVKNVGKFFLLSQEHYYPIQKNHLINGIFLSKLN